MKQKQILSFKNVSVSTKTDTEILHNISLTFRQDDISVIMGPNGSGKSTLTQAIMGNPEYKIKNSICFNNKNISNLPTEKRSALGLFLAFQSPIAIPGVSVMQILRTAYQELHAAKIGKNTNKVNSIFNTRWEGKDITISEFVDMVEKYAGKLHIDSGLLTRGIHDGFSGGERKKIELLQALILKPVFAIFDEIDTGLDVDALKTVANGIRELHKQGTGIILITHYQRILSYIPPDVVYVVKQGSVIARGDASLVSRIDKEGYKQFT